MGAKSKPNEITISRIYDAPVKTVWDAWTDTTQVAQWWGPRGFTLTTHSKDLRPGGHWSYTMHGPDGTDYINKTFYHEVVPYSRLVYDHGGNDELDRPPLFRVTATFKEVHGKTYFEMTMALESPEAAAQTRKFIKQAGGESTWDRLAEFLDEKSGKKKFFINRSFSAPINAMFEMWTDPNHVAKWLPPTGFTMSFLNVNIKPGGSGFYVMSNDTGMKMYGRTEYIEITKPNRIVYAQQFCDEKGNISRHPMAPLWPETMLTTVTLHKESENQTRVTVEWEPHPSSTPEEIAEFVKARGGMTMGWTGSFDKLELYLQEQL